MMYFFKIYADAKHNIVDYTVLILRIVFALFRFPQLHLNQILMCLVKSCKNLEKVSAR